MIFLSWIKILYKREFWPSWIFHIPTFFIRLRFAIKAKHPFFFSASNPGLYFGGFLEDTKSNIHKTIDKRFYPTTIVMHPPFQQETLKNIMNAYNLVYPIIIKPDQGGKKGEQVHKICSDADRIYFIPLLNIQPFLVQEYITGEEYSIYISCEPATKKQKILGITKKTYPTVIGNGLSTIRELIQSDERLHHYEEYFHTKTTIRMNDILSNNESLVINTIGAHSKGSLFLDRTAYKEPYMEQLFEKIFHNAGVMGIYRSDLKASSWEALCRGEYTIIELNGVFAEPTYVYDPDYGLMAAYKEIYTVRKEIYTIASYNHRVDKISYFPFFQGIKIFWRYFNHH